ncbi:MAG: hypothetical protein KBG73_13735 [Candidatus Promineofilum sp.]|jgi:hypothetical protein|nr:hypothetical protein [Promineifilum sp.]
MIKRIFLFILLGLVIGAAACQPAAATATPTPNLSPSDEEALAADALFTFFDKLQAGDFAEAAAYFGGSYEVLTGYNPEVAADDVATLWRNGCSINGLNCLAARRVTLADRPAEGEYLFNVEFTTREGELFVQLPCCGADETQQPPISVFSIRVARGEDGRYRVIDLPPYTP